MAIIKELPGLDIAVLSGGQPHKEYEDNDVLEDERTVTRYIEVRSDQNFEIRLKAAKGTHFKGDCLACEVKVDGSFAECELLEKKDCLFRVLTRLVQGSEAAGGMVRKFKFAKLETVSDGNIKHGEAAKVKNMGSITVEVSHVWLGAKDKSSSSFREHHPMEIVSEKALKGQSLSHGVVFDAPTKSTASSDAWTTKAVRGAPSPAATFIFLYRSKEALQSMLVIPRTPSPPPLEERDIDTLSKDEMKELQKRALAFKTHQESQVKIKQEKTDDNPRARKQARVSAGDILLELGDDGGFREGSTSTLTAAEKEIIELD